MPSRVSLTANGVDRADQAALGGRSTCDFSGEKERAASHGHRPTGLILTFSRPPSLSSRHTPRPARHVGRHRFLRGREAASGTCRPTDLRSALRAERTGSPRQDEERRIKLPDDRGLRHGAGLACLGDHDHCLALIEWSSLCSMPTSEGVNHEQLVLVACAALLARRRDWALSRQPRTRMAAGVPARRCGRTGAARWGGWME